MDSNQRFKAFLFKEIKQAVEEVETCNSDDVSSVISRIDRLINELEKEVMTDVKTL